MKKYVKADWYYETPDVMGEVEGILEALGYTEIEWNSSSTATDSITAYKYVTKKGKTYKACIWCYYYAPDNIIYQRAYRGNNRFLVSGSVVDDDGWLLCCGPDDPNYRSNELTGALFADLDKSNMNTINRLASGKKLGGHKI